MKGSTSDTCDLCGEEIVGVTFYLRIQSRERDTCYTCNTALKRLTEDKERWKPNKEFGVQWLEAEAKRLQQMEADLAKARQDKAEADEKARLASEEALRKRMEAQRLKDEETAKRVAELLQQEEERAEQARQQEAKEAEAKKEAERKEKEDAAAERKLILDTLSALSAKVDKLK